MKIQFEQRAVAFVDVLGFGKLVESSSATPTALATLEALVETLSSAVLYLDGTVAKNVPSELIPRHLYVSDSLILSAPLQVPSHPTYDGLSVVVMRCIQVTQLLLGRGFIVRGGIDVGDVWHSDANIIGTAYQSAYAIEHSRCDPGIELSDAAVTRWNAGAMQGSSMCSVYGESTIVNAFNEFYVESAATHGGIDDSWNRWAEIIAGQVAALPAPAAAKWTTFRAQLDAYRI